MRFRPLPFLVLICSMVANSLLADTTLEFASQRDAFATTEDIVIAVNRAADGALQAGELTVTVTPESGDAIGLVFAVAASEQAARTEFVALNGQLLKPGAYRVAVSVDGTAAETAFTLHDLTPWSSFELVSWGARSKNEKQIDNSTLYRYTLVMQTGGLDQVPWYIRAGIRQTPCCVMGGGHQMDLRTDASWADPYVLQAARRRAASYAVLHDDNPALIGIHFYDEPGLTWHKHPVSEKFVPHMVPAQVRAYEAAYGKTPIDYTQIDATNPEHVAAWKHWATWKLSLMEAAWTDATQAVSYVDDSLLALNQSQYGWSAFTDGYYFNIQRQQPIVLGHGGYHDLQLGYWTPNFFMEVALARDRSKPIWYLPTWYGSTTADELRTEQYLAFMTGIQGLMTPPPLDPTVHKTSGDAIAETNELMGRIGPAFTTLRPAPAPVGVLYSMSHMIHNQTGDMEANYAHSTRHGDFLKFVYLALRQLHVDFDFVVEEDILDGSIDGGRAIVIGSVDYLDAPVIQRLEAYIADGGSVLLSADSQLQIQGATQIPATPELAQAARIAEIIPALGSADKDTRKALLTELGDISGLRAHLQAVQPQLAPLGAAIAAAGVKPVAQVDQPGVAVQELSDGDITYTILVNATHDMDGDDPRLGLKSVMANITIPEDGRPVYDLLSSSQVGNSATLEMGIGQIAIYARTARPIGGISLATPTIQRDYTLASQPLRLELQASLRDTAGGLLNASVPVHLRVLDPAGNTRYDLYRSTAAGNFGIDLPLAENDPSGDWTVEIRELASGSSSSQTVAFQGRRVGAMAGSVQRSLVTEKDRKRILRFARVHDTVTIVPGPEAYEQAAAERLQKTLSPWGLNVQILNLADAAKARDISVEAAPTYLGIGHTPRGSIKPGTENPATHVGFAVEGPVILIGTEKNHALIGAIADNRMRGKRIPLYTPAAGRARLTWSYEITGPRQEAIVMLVGDAQAADEAAGHLYELIAGIRPLTPYALPEAVLPAPDSTADSR